MIALAGDHPNTTWPGGQEIAEVIDGDPVGHAVAWGVHVEEDLVLAEIALLVDGEGAEVFLAESAT